MKEKILKFLGETQITDSSNFTRGEEYKGYYLDDDDCPVYPYSYINDGTMPLKEMKNVMLEMRNEGLVELVRAVDSDGKPNGSGWSLTQKGLMYVVDNNLLTTNNL